MSTGKLKGRQGSNLGGYSFFVLKSLLNTFINKKQFVLSEVVTYRTTLYRVAF